MPSDQTALDYALYSAVSYDFFVFPVQPNSKFPYARFSWPRLSSNNPAQIKAWAEQYPGCNWAVDAGKSKLLILDVDVKNGKPGLDSLQDIQLMHGDIPGTLTARTPSGGYLYYMRGDSVSTVEALAPGLDTRSSGGYALLPGSIIGASSYSVYANGGVADAPQWLLDQLSTIKTRREKGPSTPVIDLDLPPNVERARTYLEVESEPAVEGSGGNNRTFAVAARVRQMGVSLEVAKEILLDHYNPRCCPPWSAQELERIAENAYQYATEQPGSAAPDHAFKPLGMKTHTQDDAGPRDAASYIGEPPARVWVIADWLPHGEVSSLYGDGGMGKSLLAQQLAVAVSSGTPFLGLPIVSTMPALCVLCEDDDHEIHRRLHAIRASNPALAFSSQQKGALKFWSRVGRNNVLTTIERDGSSTPTPFYHNLRAELAKMGDGPKLLILDTLADIYSGSEIDRGEVNQFVKFVLGGMAQAHNATILMLAHPSRAGAATGDFLSGSTAWNNAVRNRLVLKAHEKLTDHRTLTRQKSNYAAKGESIDVFWERGAFQVSSADIQDGRVETLAEYVMRAIVLAAGRCGPLGLSKQSPRHIARQTITGPKGRILDKAEKVACAEWLIAEGKVEERKNEKHGNGLWPVGVESAD